MLVEDVDDLNRVLFTHRLSVVPPTPPQSPGPPVGGCGLTTRVPTTPVGGPLLGRRLDPQRPVCALGRLSPTVSRTLVGTGPVVPRPRPPLRSRVQDPQEETRPLS